MLCAVCLYEIGTGTIGLGPTRSLVARNADTIANGQAMCIPHLTQTYDLQSPDHGPLALVALKNNQAIKASMRAQTEQ